VTFPSTPTLVSYPAGAVQAEARVLHVEPLADGRQALLLDATPFHPVDAGWPDQGPDRGYLSLASGQDNDKDNDDGGGGGRLVPVLDAVVAATDGSALHLGADIPVRKGTEGWAFVIAHVLSADADLTEGATVRVTVDQGHRRALSAGHTGCHLASLALNAAFADRWSKPTRNDALGAPDFDAAAIASSTITACGSVDVFRLNKSLRRKGFLFDGLVDELPNLGARINGILAAWVASGAAVRITCEGDALTDRRSWVCSLPEGEAAIPCGGTHVATLAELAAVEVSFSATEDGGTTVLTMRTSAPLA
jgi:alanyl-tRNA synthetase